MFVWKTCLANSFVWWNNCGIVNLLCHHNNYLLTIEANATVQYSKTCIAHKQNLGIDWKFGRSLIWKYVYCLLNHLKITEKSKKIRNLQINIFICIKRCTSNWVSFGSSILSKTKCIVSCCFCPLHYFF